MLYGSRNTSGRSTRAFPGGLPNLQYTANACAAPRAGDKGSGIRGQGSSSGRERDGSEAAKCSLIWFREGAKWSLTWLRNGAKCSPIGLYFFEHLTSQAIQFGDLAAGKVPKVAKGLSGITRKVRKRGLNGAKSGLIAPKMRGFSAVLLTVEASITVDSGQWTVDSGQ